MKTDELRPLNDAVARAALLELGGLGFLLSDVDGYFIDANEIACDILGMSIDDLRDLDASSAIARIVQSDGTPLPSQELPRRRAVETQSPTPPVVLGVDVVGRPRRWVRVRSVPLFENDKVSGALSLLQEETEAVHREQSLTMLGLINEFLAQGVTETQLLQHLCDVLTTRAGYALAWVGRTHAGSDVLDVIASSGADGYLRRNAADFHPSQRRNLTSAPAPWRPGLTQTIVDLSRLSDHESWSQRATDFGFHSGIVLSVFPPDRLVLSIYDAHAWTFDEVTVAGLEEIVRLVGNGMNHVVAQREREEALREVAEFERAARRSEESRAELSRRFELAFEHSMAPTAFSDLDDRVLAANSSYCEMMGRTRESIVGARSLTYVHPDDVVAAETEHQRLLDENLDHVSYILRYVRSDGRVIVTEVLKSRARDEDNTTLFFVTSHHDVTEEVALSTKLSHQTLHDPLTGLPNRVLFEDRLALAHARSQRTGRMDAVILFDLDGFKEVNDAHGHGVGDRLLFHVAQRLLAQTRTSDTLCRFTGDEFLYLAEGISSSLEAQMVVERLLACLEEPFGL